jgi:hypothetical protein
MRYFLFMYFVLCYHLLAGQVLKLKEVMFHTPCSNPLVVNTTYDQTCTGQENGWIKIKSDEGVLFSGGAGSVVAWKKGTSTDVKKPVGYVSGYKGRVSAKIKLPTNQCIPPHIWVKGVSTTGYTLKPQHIGLPVGPVAPGGTISFAPQAFEQEFPVGVVQCFDEFVIKWYYTTDHNVINPVVPNFPVQWTLIGESSNLLLVTHDKPIEGVTPLATPGFSFTLDEPTTFFLTSLYISCKAADGQSNNANIVNNIYTEFQQTVNGGLCVKKYNSSSSDCMKYWGGLNPLGPGCRGIIGLLKYKDANCGEWASFFNDMIKLHGIQGSKVTLVYWGDFVAGEGSLSTTDEGLFSTDLNSFFGSSMSSVIVDGSPTYTSGYLIVKNWNLTTADHLFSRNKDYPPSSPPPPSFNITVGGNTMYYGEVNGLKAQGISNPISIFTNHAIVFYDGKYYDPSYGAPVAYSKENWIANSLAGLGAAGYYLSTPTMPKGFIWVMNKTYIDPSLITFIK